MTTPVQNGRTQMTGAIRLAKARREKADTVGIDNHKRHAAAERSHLGGAPQRRYSERATKLRGIGNEEITVKTTAKSQDAKRRAGGRF